MATVLMIFLRTNQTLSFWTVHSATASWTAQNWLDSTVRICPAPNILYAYTEPVCSFGIDRTLISAPPKVPPGATAPLPPLVSATASSCDFY